MAEEVLPWNSGEGRGFLTPGPEDLRLCYRLQLCMQRRSKGLLSSQMWPKKLTCYPRGSNQCWCQEEQHQDTVE